MLMNLMKNLCDENAPELIELYLLFIYLFINSSSKYLLKHNRMKILPYVFVIKFWSRALTIMYINVLCMKSM